MTQDRNRDASWVKTNCHQFVTKMSRILDRTALSIGHDHGVVPPTEDSLFVLESCHSTWIFDTERLRFRRVLKGLALDGPSVTTAWRAYYGLEIDPISESFVVLLNPEGTRLLRSWRHVEQCPQCGGNQTAELSLDELRSASLA